MRPGGRGGALAGLLSLGAALVSVASGAAATPSRPAGAADLRLAAGFRFSQYGPDYDPGPAYWLGVGEQMSARFPGSVPGAIWIVGRLRGRGSELSFPGESDDPLIRFAAADANEETLALFDRAGVQTWLQVEPGFAAVDKLIDLVLARYGHHPCVVGVGVDVEWYRSLDPDQGEAVSDADATAWLRAARAHDPAYGLFLKHWLVEKMPPTVREGILFVDDSQIFPSIDAMVAELARWGRAFAPAPVGYQFGYESDRPWWRALPDPPKTIGSRLVELVPNLAGLYWVDFTVLEVFPPERAQRPKPPPAVSARPLVRPEPAGQSRSSVQGLDTRSRQHHQSIGGHVAKDGLGAVRPEHL